MAACRDGERGVGRSPARQPAGAARPAPAEPAAGLRRGAGARAVSAPGPDDRLDRLGQAIEDHAEQVARLRERAAELAGRTVTGEAARGQVVVTVTGGGVIQGV